MSMVIIALLLFLLLLLLPVGLASFWYVKNKNARDSVLPIRQNRTRDPRYFAHAFKELFEEAWSKTDGVTLVLNKQPEEFLHADRMENGDFHQECRHLVVAEKKNFCPPPNVNFEKEIYARQSAFLSGNTVIRAIHAEKNLDISDDTTIVRWADADGTVTVGDECDLGMSLTAGQKIVLGRNCRFRRLYAPVVQVGPVSENDADRVYLPALDPAFHHLHKRHIKSEHMDEDGILRNSVISHGKLFVDDGLTIQGSLHAERGIRIGCNTVICGNIFSNGDIYLRKNCRVLGNVFSQGDVYCESGVQIGCPGETRSVIARQHITLEKGCRVYGYLSNEDSGLCAPSGRKHRDEEATVGYAPSERFTHVVRRRTTGIAVLTISLAAVIAVTLLATLISENIKKEDRPPIPVSEEKMYENQGLEPGETLATKPTLVNDRQVEFTDRVMLRCSWTQPQVAKLRSDMNELFEVMHERYPEVNLYSMIVPLRIGFEENVPLDGEYAEIARQEREKLQRLEKDMQAATPDYCTFIPVMDVLSLHQDEYIFFRGAPAWTTRGAYYGSQEFLSAAGLEIFPIESFYETARTKGYGVLPTEDGEHVTDRRYVYLYRDYNPMVENLTAGGKAPMFSSTRNSYSAFMGGHYGVGVMDGLAENGRVLMLMGYKNAQPLATWMVTQFEKIIYVNTEIFNVETEEFWGLFEEYGVTDFLVAHDADSVPVKYLTRKYHRLAELE